MVGIGMNEYISKEYIRNLELKRWSEACGAESYAYSRVLDDIAEAPVADVVEVKHGHWVEDNGVSYCSACGEGFSNVFIDDGSKWVPIVKRNYCSNCGARMRETYGTLF